MKFTEEYGSIINEAASYMFTAEDIVKIERMIKSLKPADIDKLANGLGGLKQPEGTTVKVLNDKIKYSSDGINIDAYFNIVYDYDEGDTDAGIVITFSIKSKKLIAFSYGGAGAWSLK